jgi:enoyl-[acyl-carrier protein] reductase III
LKKSDDLVNFDTMEISFKDKVVVITGGTRGIGKSISLKFAEEGANLVINFLRNVQEAEKTKKDIENRGRVCELVRGNIAEPETAEKIREIVQSKFGKADIIVLNAASGVLKEFHQTDLKHFRWTLEINVFGQINLVKTLLDLIPEGGKIIGISSLGGVRAIPYYTLVGASKGALESALRHIAAELSPKKINVNIVSAGVVETGALRFFPNRDELIQESKRRTPLGRLVTPDDVANVVLLLASPLADMIQGQTIVVDGGYSILA